MDRELKDKIDTMQEFASSGGCPPPQEPFIASSIRTFDTGATRNSLEGKLQYSRFLEPEVFKRYCEYMESHRVQADGSVRDPDNWKKGIGQDVYMDSLYRHVTNLWGVYNGYERLAPETGEPETKQELLCAIMFNVIGYMYELIKEEENDGTE